MTPFPERHRIKGIQVSGFRCNLLGGVGDFAKLVLLDEEARPLAYSINQKFSERTLRIIEALRQSLEQDMFDIVEEPEQTAPEFSPDSEEGLTFG